MIFAIFLVGKAHIKKSNDHSPRVLLFLACCLYCAAWVVAITVAAAGASL